MTGVATLFRPAGAAREAERTFSAGADSITDWEGFVGMEDEWNGLAEATNAPPCCRHEFIRSYLHNFAPRAPLRVELARDLSGRLVSVLPLIASRSSIRGVPVKQLEAPANVHSLRFDLIDREATDGASVVFERLAQAPGWDVLRISDVPEDGKAWRVYRAAQSAGFPTGAWESHRSPYLLLPSSYDELLRGLRGKFKANLHRRKRRLAEKGQVTVERLSGETLSENDLEVCFDIERNGWKGRQGSAVTQSRAVHDFHLDLFRTPWFSERLSLFVLKVAGKPIAFHYGHTVDGVFSLIMTSYDETYREFGPGHILTEEVLADCISRQLREFDFLGCDLPWKLDWTNRVRTHHWLYIFRNSLKGRILKQMKFEWARAARLLLARTP
jgi:CelD/BcsL family acetyltransferase involved in cellulose biosynthesis